MKKSILAYIILTASPSIAGDSYLNCDFYQNDYIEPAHSVSEYLDRDEENTFTSLEISTNNERLLVELTKSGDIINYDVKQFLPNQETPVDIFSTKKRFAHYEEVTVFKKETAEGFEEVSCMIID